MYGIDKSRVSPVEPNTLWHVLEEWPRRIQGCDAAQTGQTVAAVAADVRAQTVADQVAARAVVIEFVFEELEQICQLGADNSRIGSGYCVGCKIAPMDNYHVDRVPQPQERILHPLDPDNALYVVQPPRDDDLCLERWIKAGHEQVVPVPGAEHETLGMLAVVQLELGFDAAPVPWAHIEWSVGRVVEFVAEREAADV